MNHTNLEVFTGVRYSQYKLKGTISVILSDPHAKR